MKNKANRLLALIDSQQWLISQEWIDTFRAIASRENDINAFLADKELYAAMNDPTALLASHEGTIAGTNAIKRDKWAIIPVMGPIFPRANMFTQISGGASIEMIARDTHVAMDQGLTPLLYISSPGGVVEGVSDYGKMLADSNAMAFVSGNCTSAAYWLASQCQSIMISDTAVMGNIGVKGPNPRGNDDSIVSDNAPNKKMTAGMVKGMVNDIESVFLQAVADGRKTTVDDVKENFGKGGVFVGKKAVDARLADGITTLEALLTLSANQASETYRKPEMAMTDAEKKAHADEISALNTQLTEANTKAETAEAALAQASSEKPEDAERERISAILDSAKDKPVAAMTMAMKTNLSADDAINALADMPVEAKGSNDPLKAALDGTNPAVGDEGDEPEPDEDKEATASWDAIIKGAA